LEAVLEYGEGSQLACAHVFNPWFSALGTVSGGRTLREVFGEQALRLLAVETGLTSTPLMCRRVSSLDRHTLFSCSDAHSLQNLGRECTLLEIEPSFNALMAAIKTGGNRKILGTLKFPVERTRYFRNRCGACKESFDGENCPVCGRPLVKGSRDRLQSVADREAPLSEPDAPPFCELLPLGHLLADLLRVGPDSKTVGAFYLRMVQNLGHERFILTEATQEDVSRVSTPQIARAVVQQRTISPTQRIFHEETLNPNETQLSLGLD
jgi:PHP family Zn ribbon phosphoesterase